MGSLLCHGAQDARAPVAQASRISILIAQMQITATGPSAPRCLPCLARSWAGAGRPIKRSKIASAAPGCKSSILADHEEPTPSGPQ